MNVRSKTLLALQVFNYIPMLIFMGLRLYLLGNVNMYVSEMTFLPGIDVHGISLIFSFYSLIIIMLHSLRLLC